MLFRSTHEAKQKTVPKTFVAKEIYNAGKELLHSIWRGGADKPLRSLSVNVSALSDVSSGVQMALWEEKNEKQQQLEFSLDKIRKKFGFDAIGTANTLHNDLVSKNMASEEDLLPFKR